MADIRQKRVLSEEHKEKLRIKKPRSEQHRKNLYEALKCNKFNWKGGADRICCSCGNNKVHITAGGSDTGYCKSCSNKKRTERFRKYRQKLKAEMQGGE